MAETTPLLPPASSGPSRRLRTSAAAAVIGLLLALVLVASLSASKSPVALESDGEHDIEEHMAKNIYAMSGKSYYPTNPKTVTKKQQRRYAALLKEQDTERSMDDGFFRSGAGNPDSPSGFKS